MAELQATAICDHIVGNPPVAYLQSFCPRCNGKGYYGGFTINPVGMLQSLTPTDSLIQSIKKILTENIRPTGYGFNYALLSGTIDTSKLQAIKNEVVRCLNYLKFIQNQEILRGFKYNPQERINSISSIIVIQDTQDPRNVNISATIITVSATKISVPSIKLTPTGV